MTIITPISALVLALVGPPTIHWLP